MDDRMFRRLDTAEEAAFRAWAREHWHPGDPINPVWHPVVRDECARIRRAARREERAKA